MDAPSSTQMPFMGKVIFGIILVMGALYIIFYVIYPGPGNNDMLTKMTPLNQPKVIVTSDVVQQKLLGNGGCTIMGFFKLNDGDRTSKAVNQFTPLIYIENNWYLEIAPSPVGKEHTSARLRVKTNDGTVKEEMIELPPIPKQKWVFIAILREGRRFDVIYDNKIVSSERLQSYPVIISSPLSVGNIGLDGSVIHVITNSSRISPNDVERERITRVDTNNMILEANWIDISLPALKLFAQCPSGLPCDPVTKPPSNNLVEWSTPYA